MSASRSRDCSATTSADGPLPDRGLLISCEGGVDTIVPRCCPFSVWSGVQLSAELLLRRDRHQGGGEHS